MEDLNETKSEDFNKIKKADFIVSITRSKPSKNSQTRIPIQKISYYDTKDSESRPQHNRQSGSTS